MTWRLGCFWSFFCHSLKFFLNDKKELGQFGHNVRKYKIVSAVAKNFNTNIRQMTKISQQRKQAGGYINRQ